MAGARRETDKVSSDESLEILASLAYEYALKNDNINIEVVETAILKCRELKVEPTGTFRALRIKI